MNHKNLEGRIANHGENDIIITQCAECRQYRTVDGDFIKINEALEHIYETAEHIHISHTYCKPCKEEAIKKIYEVKFI